MGCVVTATDVAMVVDHPEELISSSFYTFPAEVVLGEIWLSEAPKKPACVHHMPYTKAHDAATQARRPELPCFFSKQAISMLYGFSVLLSGHLNRPTRT